MRRGDHFLLARLGRRVVGTVRWSVRREFAGPVATASPTARCRGLAVSMAHRRVGIGAVLLASRGVGRRGRGLRVGPAAHRHRGGPRPLVRDARLDRCAAYGS